MLEDNTLKIKEFILDRYKENLAGILIFGSANTGEFKEEDSDIDHMIFLKEQGKINFEEETQFLIKSLKDYHFATQYFHSLESIKNYIGSRKSFSTYITIVSKDGSRIVYTTPEFEKTKEYLKRNPPTKEEIQKFIEEKDKFELEGYFTNLTGYPLLKQLMCHLRRKLQILNYFKTGELVFDYNFCLNNLEIKMNEKNDLKKLYERYKNREELSSSEVDYYKNLAAIFTENILKEDNK